MISCIVAKAHHDVIGKSGALPWYLPADLRHFKDLTMGHTVVMGRKTFQSIIDRNRAPLPGRRNIVVTRDTSFSYPDVDVINDIKEIARYDDCFIIGGAELWCQTLPIIDRLYVTEIDAEIDGDVYFPALDADTWREVSREPHHKDGKNPYDYDFVIYERR